MISLRIEIDHNFNKFLLMGLKTLCFVLKVSGGREGRPIGAYELAKAVEELGAGEILLNCIDCDGEDDFLVSLDVINWELNSMISLNFQPGRTCRRVHTHSFIYFRVLQWYIFSFSGQGKGFDIDLVRLISDAVSIPVIASSGAGTVEHFTEVFSKTNASAALAAGIFHRKEVHLQLFKNYSMLNHLLFDCS